LTPSESLLALAALAELLGGSADSLRLLKALRCAQPTLAGPIG